MPCLRGGAGPRRPLGPCNLPGSRSRRRNARGNARGAAGRAGDASDSEEEKKVSQEIHTNPTPERSAASGAGAAARVSTSRPARVAGTGITSDPLDTARLAAAVADPAAGAVATFDGRVRNHDGGRGVRAIRYSAHPSANEVLTAIATEIADREGLRALAVAHRVGELAVGETALAVAVSADHRAAAFGAVHDIVEEVKARLPVWKQQIFSDGSSAWSNLP
ncbi:molybdenum cofactor biosynthesis protein MoaE [Actinomyces sp. 594]|nr:molybdenum cofactor biosynthesis protein MoaE [Actinomyces sp. 594]NDR53847.1 molybdenum cofactor biosynthesis protein MoaE [Actinomyces sp. 565]